MAHHSNDSLNVIDSLVDGEKRYAFFSLEKASERLPGIERLPYCLKVLLENLLRHEDGRRVNHQDFTAFAQWLIEGRSDHEIAFHPARVLMQDFTGVPAVVDLAAMRDAIAQQGGNPTQVNPRIPVDLVIDHSVMVDNYGSDNAFDLNVKLEMQRNRERYALLRWGQQAFDNFRVVPPGTGICHQVNLEYLARVVWQEQNGDQCLVYPDTLVGTDSHTTMINGLAVLGWGVGGIEAEAAMLGQPISMLIPEVVGFRLVGKLREGVTATDLVLTITQQLRKLGVVGKFVEFFGPGLDDLGLPDRATIANMAPEYGATCGIFPIDEVTLRYLRLSGRPEQSVSLVKAYARAQGLWRNAHSTEPRYSEVVELDLDSVEPSIAGPRRPQDRTGLSQVSGQFTQLLEEQKAPAVDASSAGDLIDHGHVVIAAITSCTNTSNPAVMIAAGLVARNARRRGLRVKPWVKTSLAPGSQVVSDYLRESGLQADLDALGFNLVGYGCTTCIGNSGPLEPAISQAIEAQSLITAAVLSGNRNFEGRINPLVRASYLASPPLVVAYALAGSVRVDLQNAPIGTDEEGKDVYLSDIWPDSQEIQTLTEKHLTSAMFEQRYANVFEGPPAWRGIDIAEGATFAWEGSSTYVQHPPYFTSPMIDENPSADINGARPLAILGDSVTTDHISPAGNIALESAAGRYLTEQGVAQQDFNSYGARRGNHEVMIRGTFANIRLQNLITPDARGGVTRHMPDGQQMTIYDAATRYQQNNTPTVVIAGLEYGSGSSRDWAAKGTRLLGVRAVIARSFERIHRSNLVGMGVLPLTFTAGEDAVSLGITAQSVFDITGLDQLTPGMQLEVTHHRADGEATTFTVTCRIDTREELLYYQSGGILTLVLQEMAGTG